MPSWWCSRGDKYENRSTTPGNPASIRLRDVDDRTDGDAGEDDGLRECGEFFRGIAENHQNTVMKASSCWYLANFRIKTALFKKKDPIIGIIDKMWGIMRNEAFPKYIKM